MAGNFTRPTVTITSPVGKKILTGEGNFLEYNPAPTVYKSEDRSFPFTVLYDFTDDDGHILSGVQVQILKGEDVVWDSGEIKMKERYIHGSGLIPFISPGHMVIPKDAKLKPGIIYGVKVRARDEFDPDRWEMMSSWSEVKYFELISEKKAWIAEVN